jgi:hypothetical protein
VLGGRQVTELFVEPLLVVEADPVKDLVLGVPAGFSRGRSGSALAFPLAGSGTLGQSRSPALADIIGARRMCTVAIISGSMPCR